ncbi:hypothetical protein [Curtobacterium sp. 1310]|uniref:hypothetical protein n=1 Tax=Curtobacterium sp. 1310 TaxID=2806570 RepID=UPI001AE5A9DD|nr:hypothetical protein [Curtobacterium sp. 1310]MBP1301443.1 hypothetical protein [Curtobacterium sp. 1310]
MKLITAALPFVMDPLLDHSRDKLEDAYNRAKVRHDFLTAVLLSFRLELDQAVEDKVLIESPK